MHLGVFSYNTDYGIRVDRMARALEERGFESLWIGEHSHIPASRETPYPGGGHLPRPYYHMADPFVSLAAAAAVTTDLKLATGICLVIERDPIMLAKEVASLDQLSDGRFIFGIGAGWNAEEMENHGTPFARRWQVLRERIAAMKLIWAEEEASYHGEFVDFERIISYPKPVQSPHPPILMGSATAGGRRRVVEYCDGWIPIDVLLEDLAGAIADLRRRAEAAGRDGDGISVSVFAFDGANADALEGYRDMGVDRVVLISPRHEAEAMAFLDLLAPLTTKLG